MLAALFIALYGFAFIVRDGWPDFNSLTGGVRGSATERGWLGTNTGARPAAALICALAGFLVFGLTTVDVFSHQVPITALFGLAVWVSFYSDMMHAKGQRADGWMDTLWLTVSGVTSAAPIALAAWFLLSPYHAGLVLTVSLAKPVIWEGCRVVRPERWWGWLVWTRTAAGLFGATLGSALAV